MDVVLQQRSPEYGSGRFYPKAASGHGCITVLLLGPVKIEGITGQRIRRAAMAISQIRAGLPADLWRSQRGKSRRGHIH